MEPRGNFRDASGALGNDDEVHDHQNREHDNSDHVITAHHEIAERLDDVTGGRGALMAVRQDQPRGGEIERQPEHGGDQKDGRERREFQRGLDKQRGHQDQDGERDRDREKEVEHDRGQGKDQHHQNGEDAECQREIAALQDGADFTQTRKPARWGRRALTSRNIHHRCCFPP